MNRTVASGKLGGARVWLSVAIVVVIATGLMIPSLGVARAVTAPCPSCGGGGGGPLGASIFVVPPSGVSAKDACVASTHGVCISGLPTSYSTPITSPSTGQLYGTSFNGFGAGGTGSYTFSWNSPWGTSTSAYPTWTPTKVGTYDVYLTVSSSGYGSVTIYMQVTVYQPTSAPACYAQSYSAGLAGGAVSFNECGTKFIDTWIGAGGTATGIVTIILATGTIGSVVGTIIAGVIGLFAAEAAIVDQGNGVYLGVIWTGNWAAYANPVSCPAFTLSCW